MSLPRFYLKDQVLSAEPGETFPLRLAPDDAQHARVLRLRPKEHVAVIDAERDYFECEIVSFDDEVPTVRITRHGGRGDAGPTVMLVQGLAKGDKMETVIRHATELGVSMFLPLICERSVVRLDARKAAARTERWRSIAKSAAMQSGQPAVPEVCEPLGVDDASAILGDMSAVLVCWEEAPSTARLADALAVPAASGDDARVAVVVGPEGGLAEHEVNALLAANPRSSLVSLGPSILRTETAGIVASALAIYELGGLGAGSASDSPHEASGVDGCKR